MLYTDQANEYHRLVALALGHASAVADFFVSYNQADRAWAEWIAWELENAGYSTIIQAWDFHGNFVVEMDKAAKEAARTVAVLSPDYLTSRFTPPEWAAAFARDPTSERDILIPVRVGKCDLSGLLAQINYVDFVGRDEAEAARLLLARVRGDRRKPSQRPHWPGGSRAVGTKPAFPGPAAHTTGGLDVLQACDSTSTGQEALLEQPHLRLWSGDPLALVGGGIEPPQTIVDFDAVSRAFGTASRLLLGWPQETDGHWIERPELEHLHALGLQPEPALAVLLSEPGGGKSALLARLGNKLAAEGVILLAIKADQLPRTIGDLDDLDDWVGAPMPVAEALRGLARDRRVVLLIDQLDALADLMDQHSQRLSVLLRLVGTVRAVENLQILLSCREFEYRNDIRLATLGAEAITLARPTWEQISSLIVNRGIDPSAWTEEVREVLRTPQHIAVFLNHLPGQAAPTFSSYQAMLEQVVQQLERDCGSRALEVAECIAITMSEEEELSLGAARFERAWREELIRLEAASVLVYSDDRLSLTFRHQTLFEFLRSRAFLRTGTSVTDYVIHEKQESLFVRPLLWSALHYMRSADRGMYRREFGRLWTQAGLRQHLRYLLIAFVGRLSDPDDQEARWLLPTLDKEDLRRKSLIAMIGSPGWFARLSGRLGALMAAPPETAWDAVGLLRKAIEFDCETVLALLERYWLPRDECDALTVRVIDDQKGWDARGVAVAARVVGRGNIGAMFVQHLAENIQRSQPNCASIVIVRYLEACLKQIAASRDAAVEPLPADASCEQKLLWQLEHDKTMYGAVSRLLDDRSDFYRLDKLAAREPKSFVTEIWPWLLQVLEWLAEEHEPLLNQYRSHYGLSFTRGDNASSYDGSIPKAIEAAVGGFAEADPEPFLIFVEQNKIINLIAVHRLLAIGLEKIAQAYPQAVLSYLLEDPRRLAVGDFQDAHRESRRLIAAVVPQLSPEECLRLERAICGWQLYHQAPVDEDAKTRFERRKFVRGHRLRLLRAFPATHLSESGRRQLLEEERALPHTRDYDTRSIGVGWVGSPMTAAQMATASDDNIVALFEGLVDATGWDHPRRRWVERQGGSVPAAREFAAFAKNHPDRVLRMFERFQPGLQERPTGEALATLGESEAVPSARLVREIEMLSSRGFASAEFRWGAAKCLRAIAIREKGLDDTTCELLEGWLTEWKTPEPVHHSEERRQQTSTLAEDPTDSLLWGHGRSMVLPGGNYPLLEALTLGYLLRRPMNADQWLGALERHLLRHEDPAVWEALTDNLRFLVNAERGRAVAFLKQLLEAQPSILASDRGVLLIAHIHGWLPGEMFAHIADAWIMGSWPRGAQAAGEVATLRLCQRPEDPDAREPVERFISATDYDPAVVARLRLGVAHTLVQAWSEPPLRALSTPLLLRVLPVADESVAEALHLVFARTDPLPPDDHTRLLLQAMLKYPETFFAREPTFLVDRVKDLLREGWEPELIHGVVATVLDRAGTKLSDMRTAWPVHAGDLVEIALTLHHMPETRSRGLDLFEKLMLLDASGIEERLRVLDRRPFR